MQLRSRILGELLVSSGAVSGPRLDEGLRLQAEQPRRIGEILVERGWADSESVARALAAQLGIPVAEPPLRVDPGAPGVLPEALAHSARAVALEVHPRRLTVATDEPTRIDVIDDLRFRTGRRLELRVGWPEAIDEALRAGYGDPLSRLVSAVDAGLPDGGAEEGSALERAAASAPVVRLVDRLLEEASRARASDLHLEPDRSGLRVRLRVDGILRETHRIPERLQRLILSRLKIMAGMDIAVRLRPQDGGLRTRIGRRELALRISTLPVQGREKGVVRLLDPHGGPTGLDALGMRAEDREQLERILDGRQGVLLTTGPTGSGKSSTLHAALRRVDRDRRNVVTLEDPIEYPIPGATQVQVHPRAGLTFPAALRAVLRQDPDVVMVGEIRDGETAEIAMAGAVTGHLVLSSLHTNDAPSAVVRLVQMGVPRHLVASGLAGVLAQRLVRRICTACRGGGCDRCREGFHGRIGVFQLLVPDARLREAIAAGAPSETLARMARESGMARLVDDARRLVAEGVTTPAEVARVIRGEAVARPCRRCEREIPEGARACPWCGRAIGARCGCGQRLETGWRFCPECIRPVAA